ncbi:MAG: hypothetical protein FWH17_02515 [Oscillospiraceae bacterium]|nr:hypothetical protein [Oscillospiraceae bacterium]
MWDFIVALFSGDAFDYLIGIIWPFIQSILETIFLAFLLVPINLIKLIQQVVGIFAGTRDIQVVTSAATEGAAGSLEPLAAMAERTVENTTFLEYFFNQPFITRAFWGVTLIAFTLCLGFSIVAVIRSTGDLQQNRPLGKVIGSIGKAMLTFLLVPFMCISAIWLTTIVMRQTEELFSTTAEYGEEVSLEGAMLVSSVQPHHVRMWRVTQAYRVVNLGPDIILGLDMAHPEDIDPNSLIPYYILNDPRFAVVEEYADEKGYKDIRNNVMEADKFNRKLHQFLNLDIQTLFGGRRGSLVELELSLSLASGALERIEQGDTGEGDAIEVKIIGRGPLSMNYYEAFLSRVISDNEERSAEISYQIHGKDGEIWELRELVIMQKNPVEEYLPAIHTRTERWKQVALSEIPQMEADAQAAAAAAQSALRAYEDVLAAYEESFSIGRDTGVWLSAWDSMQLSTALRDAETIYNEAKQEADDTDFVLRIAKWVLIDDYQRSRPMYQDVESQLESAGYESIEGIAVAIGSHSISEYNALLAARDKYPGFRYYMEAFNAADLWDSLYKDLIETIPLLDACVWFAEMVSGRGVRIVEDRISRENYNEQDQLAEYYRVVAEYLFGRKGVGFRDMSRIRHDFNVFDMFFGGIGLFSIAAAWYMVIILLMIVVVFIRRIFEVIVLYVVSPFFVSTIPLDDGKRFGSWRDMFISRLLAGFGSIFTLNVFMLMLPMIWNPALILSESSFVDTLLKLIFMAGGIFTVWKSHTLISQIINPQGAASEQESSVGALALSGMALGAGMSAVSSGTSLAMGAHAGMKSGGSGSSGDTGGGSGGGSGGSGGSSGNKNPTLDGSSLPALPPPKPPGAGGAS